MSTRIILKLVALAVVFAGLNPLAGWAQEEEDPGLENAHTQFKSMLDQVDKLFYKEMKTDSGVRYYAVMWEADGELSKIQFEVRNLGKYGGEPIYGILAYSMVAQIDGSLPPAVIKSVATKNETTGMGAFSMTEDFSTVYINYSGPCDTITPGQVWLVCAFLHKNRMGMKAHIQELMSAS